MSCLRRTGGLLTKALCIEGQNLPSPLLQFVRGVKPRWIPKSKSKIFYVRKPTPIVPEESEELRTMYFHYRTKLRAIRNFMFTRHRQHMASLKAQSAKEDKDTLENFQTMEDEVNQWNSRVQIVREEIAAKEEQMQQDRVKMRQEREELIKQRQLVESQKRVAQNAEDSKSFITLDNLDEEIEKILNLRQDYNFAIDKQGNKIEEFQSDYNAQPQEQEAVKR